jgi:outer membrane protein assembly factor BamB
VAGSAGLYCLSVKDGSEVWKIKADLGMSSPLVVNGRVFVYEGDRSQDAYKWHSAKSLTAFNGENGQVLWRQPKVGNCNGSVVQWVSGGKNYLISGAPGGPWCVDPDTGDVVWSHPAGSPGVAGIWTCDGTPVVSGDIVVLYAEPKMAFKMTPQKAEFLWKVPNGSRGASPLIYNDYAYFLGSQGQVLCVELKTGAVKWNKGGVTGEVSSPILADGKIFYDGLGNPASVGMFKASQEKFEELSRFQSQTTGAASPAIVDGKLYVRSKEGVACYDLREHGPYLGDVSADKSGIVFSIKQAEGGLAVKDSPDGTILGVTITGADGKATTAKARARGSDIVVDIQGVNAPMEIHSAWSNSVTTKAGMAVADLHWKSQALSCRQISGSVVTLAFNKAADADVWKTEKAYSMAGMKVSNVELASDRLTVRLTMDRALKIGEVLSIKYPWFGAGATDVPPAELKFTALPGRPVEGGLLQEFLLGETAGDKKGATAAALLDGDALDKEAKPAAGGKWKLVESVVRSRSGELGTVNLVEHTAQSDSLTHACVYVYSDANRKVQFSLGSCTAIRIFVNGKAVHTNLNATAPDPFAPDVDKVKDVELAKGWNTVLLSIVGSGGWRGFSLRIRDENGNAPSGLSYTAEKPAEN